jgi:MoaA/NifB/PqqE/SkfB family radical SAM enzyme
VTPVLAQALALATTPAPAPKPAYVPSGARAITRRGILWLGQTCNLRCHFCYFLDRIEDETHAEHAFMRLEKAMEICRTLVEHYGNNSIDIQGGEPTLYSDIYSLVAYCAEIGLSPTIITNAQVLSNREKVAQFRAAGLRDFLVSVQGLGDVYDELVGSRGAHVRQMKALCHLQEEGIPFRFNTVVSKPALDQLVDIAELAVRTGAEVVNFLGFNPFKRPADGEAERQERPALRRGDRAHQRGPRRARSRRDRGERPVSPVLRRRRAPSAGGLRLPADPLRSPRERLRELVMDRSSRAAHARGAPHAAGRPRSAPHARNAAQAAPAIGRTHAQSR